MLSSPQLIWHLASACALTVVKRLKQEKCKNSQSSLVCPSGISWSRLLLISLHQPPRVLDHPASCLLCCLKGNQVWWRGEPAGGITGVMVPADRFQGQGCDFYRLSLQVTAQPQIHEYPLTLFSICHIILFGNASLLHTRAVFRSGRCFVTVSSLFVMPGVFLLALADVPPRLLQPAIFIQQASTLFQPGLFNLSRSVISHPHFLKPWMSEIPHAFQCLHSRETW